MYKRRPVSSTKQAGTADPLALRFLRQNAADLKVRGTKNAEYGRSQREEVYEGQANWPEHRQEMYKLQGKAEAVSQGRAAEPPTCRPIFAHLQATFAPATPIVETVSALEQCNPKSGHKEERATQFPPMRRHIQFSELGMKGQSGSSRAL